MQVQQALEKRNMAAANEKPTTLPVLANCFAYAGMPEQVCVCVCVCKCMRLC